MKGFFKGFLVAGCFFIFLAAQAYAGELPDWMNVKPLPIEPELVRPTAPDDFVFVKGGCYEMGDTFGDGGREEKPVHEVCIDDFYIGKYEVTVGEFRDFVKKTGYKTDAENGDGCYYYTAYLSWEKSSSRYWDRIGFSQTDSNPVGCVSWNDANEYVSWKSKATGDRYRLPTEAEWEYAARSGGKKEKWSGTSSESSLGDYAWYEGISGGKTHPVGQKRPNGLGLYDMSGNVLEWVSDRYDERYYYDSSRDNPQGPSSGQLRVLRGGSWYFNPMHARTSNRQLIDPAISYTYFGFRFVKTINK